MDNTFVSIDGPTASGKTTLGVRLACHLGLPFLDTGLSYRAAAFVAQRDAGTFGSSRIPEFIRHLPGRFDKNGVVSPEAIIFNGVDITGKIWGPELDQHLKQVAADPHRRAEILSLHKGILARETSAVIVGRDVAVTLLASSASLHVYLTANLAVRRERRRAQYLDSPERSAAVGAATARDLENCAAIKQMRSSVVIDSTYLPVDAVFQCALRGLDNDARS